MHRASKRMLGAPDVVAQGAATDAALRVSPSVTHAGMEELASFSQPNDTCLSETVGLEAHTAILRGQPLAAAGGAAGALRDEREGDGAMAAAPDPPLKRPKNNKARRLLLQASRQAAREALQADIAAVDREIGRRHRGWARDYSSLIEALYADIQGQIDLAEQAVAALHKADSDVAAESARTATAACELSLRKQIDALMVELGVVPASSVVGGAAGDQNFDAIVGTSDSQGEASRGVATQSVVCSAATLAAAVAGTAEGFPSLGALDKEENEGVEHRGVEGPQCSASSGPGPAAQARAARAFGFGHVRGRK